MGDAKFPLDIPSIERRKMAEQFAEARGLRIQCITGVWLRNISHVDDAAECSQDYYRMRELASSLGLRYSILFHQTLKVLPLTRGP